MTPTRARIFQHGVFAGILEAQGKGLYRFTYDPDYAGPAISFAMPLALKQYEFDSFPPLFEGLLPEGLQLEALLRINKLDRDDLMGQLLAVGGDVVGSLTITGEP
jgi:serine/threonine-protein kinase HipA